MKATPCPDCGTAHVERPLFCYVICDCYDGAADSNSRVGVGRTTDEAVEDWNLQIEEETCC